MHAPGQKAVEAAGNHKQGHVKIDLQADIEFFPAFLLQKQYVASVRPQYLIIDGNRSRRR